MAAIRMVTRFPASSVFVPILSLSAMMRDACLFVPLFCFLLCFALALFALFSPS